MTTCMRVAEGSKPFAHCTTSPLNRPPVYVACASVCRRRGRPRKWVWLLPAGSGTLPYCDKDIAREISDAQMDKGMEDC